VNYGPARCGRRGREEAPDRRQMSKFNWAHRLMTITKFVIVISGVG